MSAPTHKRAYAPPLTEVWFCQPRSIICTSGNVNATLTDPFEGFTEDPWGSGSLH